VTKRISKSSLIVICSLVSLALAMYFGSTSSLVIFGGRAYDTDWGKLALTIIFGISGCLGLASIFWKSE
jgi:hypothetical protein